MKLLVLARKFNELRPEVIGGVIVSSQNLLRYLCAAGVDYDFIDTNKTIYRNKITAFVSIIFHLALLSRNANHIALNLNRRELVYIAPIAVLFAKLTGATVSLRVFGGNFNKIHEKNCWYKRIIDFVLNNSCVVFLQTKYLVNKYRYLENVVQLPTCRNYEGHSHRRIYERKFVFVGQVKKTKGIGIVLEAVKKVNNIQVDIYGPCIDYSIEELDVDGINYKGPVKYSDIQKVLSDYDFLLLPTFHDGEGYPGTILESYMAGTPVIATNWKSIPELVEDGKTGYLIEPHCVNGLVNAIEKIDDDIYQHFKKNVIEVSRDFDCGCLYKNYVDKIMSSSELSLLN